MSNVFTLRRTNSPAETVACLKKLLARAEHPSLPLTGLAFVAYVDDTGYIADACGKARAEPEQTRQLLHALDAKLKRWAMT